MTISAESYMLFEKYKKRVDFYTRTSPFELSYQRVIESLLEAILEGTDIEVIVSDRFAKNGTQSHHVNAYKQVGTSSPDLILAKKFSYLNPPEAQYIAFVEVKKPGHIKFDRDRRVVLNKHDSTQLSCYLDHPKIHRLIFTDCYTWIFYRETSKQHKKLFDLNLNQIQEDSGAFCDDPDTWSKLHDNIYEFLTNN